MYEVERTSPAVGVVRPAPGQPGTQGNLAVKYSPNRAPASRRRGKQRRGLTRAQTAEQDRAARAAARGRPTRDTGVYRRPAVGTVAGRGYGGAGGAAAGALGHIHGQQILAQWARDARRLALLRLGRRGALATRAPVVGTGQSRTNRTGAAAAPIPGIAAPVNPSSTGQPAPRPAARVDPAPAPAPRPASVPQQAPAPRPAPQTVPARQPAINWRVVADPFQQLWNALRPSPRPALARSLARNVSAARVVNPLPTTLGTVWSPAPAASPLLTAANSPMLGFSAATQPQPQPQSDACAKCADERKKDKKGEKRCRNPVVSRTTSGNIRTTKTRLVCRPSKLKFL